MSPGPRTPAHLAALILLLVLAAGARLHGIGERGLWFDEIASVLRAEGRYGFVEPDDGVVGPKIAVAVGPVRGLDSVVNERGESLPWGYFVALRWWKDIAGDGAGTLRLLSALAAVLAVAAGAASAGAIGGQRAGLFAATLLVLAPLEVEYAQEVRSYAFASLFATVATWALVRLEDGAIDDRARRALWVAYAVAIAAGMGSHYTAVVVPAAHAAYWLGRVRPAALAPPPLALGAAALFFAPFIGPLAKQAVHAWGSIAWVGGEPPPSVAGFLGVRAHVPGEALALVSALADGLHARPWVGAALALAASGLGVAALRANPDRRAWVVALVALAAPAALLGLDLVKGTHGASVPRFAIASSVAVWTLAGIGLARLPARVAGTLLVLCLAAQADGYARLRETPSKMGDFRAAAQALTAEGCDERDLVILVLPSESQIIELNVHLPGAPAEMLVKVNFDATALEQPWRNVFVIVRDGRQNNGRRVRDLVAQSIPLRGTLVLDRLVLYRLSKER
jgi:hypothetical protein